MKVYITLHTDGNRTYHKTFYEKFNKEYGTDEKGFIGDEKWSETEGIKEYDLTLKKYTKLNELFNKVGFDVKDFYYSCGRPIHYIDNGEPRNKKLYGEIVLFKLQTYNNGSMNIEKLKFHNYYEYAKSFIMFHTEPVYD